MQKLSNDFGRHENVCKCGCGRYSADIELVEVMQNLRDILGVRIFVSSWYRCPEHNDRPKTEKNERGVYGAGSNSLTSYHPAGAAADFRAEGMLHADLAKLIRQLYPDRYGLGLYSWGVHLDIRPVRADWVE